MPDQRHNDRSPSPDSRLVPGAYVTRRDGSGGLFEVIAIWWDRNFGLGGLHLGAALLEDARTGEITERPPARVLTDYTLVRGAAPMET